MRLIGKAKSRELSVNGLVKALAALERGVGEVADKNANGGGSNRGRKRGHAVSVAADIDDIINRAKSRPRSQAAGTPTVASSNTASAAVVIGTPQHPPHVLSNIPNPNVDPTSSNAINAHAVLPYEVRFHLYDLLGARLIEQVSRGGGGGAEGPGYTGRGLENCAVGESILRLAPSK